MDLHTQESPGGTFSHLLFSVNHKISAFSILCVVTETEIQKNILYQKHK